MKYIEYWSKALFTPIRKFLGFFWYWVAVWFREPAREVCYNYFLNNGIWVKRIQERNPMLLGDLWVLQSTRFEEAGIFKRRDVGWLEFQFWYWFVWIWNDDDSNYDTTDLGFLEKLVLGIHYPWLGKPFRGYVKGKLEEIKKLKFGNTFELGSKRNGKNSWFNPVCSGFWNLRNTAYNAKYKQFESDEPKDLYFEMFGKAFGWVETEVVNGKQNWHMLLADEIKPEYAKYKK